MVKYKFKYLEQGFIYNDWSYSESIVNLLNQYKNIDINYIEEELK